MPRCRKDAQTALCHDSGVRKKQPEKHGCDTWARQQSTCCLTKWAHYSREIAWRAEDLPEERDPNGGRFRSIEALKKLSLARSDQSFSGVVEPEHRRNR
jgi:hypothetical protein